MVSAGAVAEVLDIASRDRGSMSLLDLANEVAKGLPVTALDHVVRSVAPQDRGFAFRVVPRATLARRRAAGAKVARLSADEGATVARLAEVWAFARDVWKSDEAARGFLFRPHPLLEGRRPVDLVLESELGRPLVENILGGLKYGTAV